jgi:hypothetical protein
MNDRRRLRWDKMVLDRSSDTMSWSLHVSLSCGGTWIEIFLYQFFVNVQASIDETTTDSFE